VLASALIWAAHYERWTLAQWQEPTDYVGDAHEMLARIKAVAESDTSPLTPQVIERLGAPFGAHWNGYPTPDKPLMWVLGELAVRIGLFAAANVGLLLAQISAALAFYFAARWLRCRWEWAWAGALLFAYTYHTFHRGLAHFSFVFTWTVPLGLLAVWLVAQSRRLEWRSPGTIVCLGVAVALGVSNPYNLLFWGQLLGWALVAQWFRARRRANLAIGLTAGIVAITAFLVSNADVWMHVEEPEGLPLLSRNYGGTERYALKPLELFIPPQYHRLDVLASFGERYKRWSDWRGEDYMPYLGVVGIVGMTWLAATGVRRLLLRQSLPGQALSTGWLLAYATVGGLTNLLAFFVGFQVFRATNRAAIFISALVLFFLVGRLSRLTARWPAHWRVVAALAVAIIGVLDQVPRRWPEEVRARMSADVASDVKLGRELEAALPPGAMIFQIPVLGFPEVLPPFRLADYEHFRPFLTTQTLRFSYGAAKFRARSRWQRDLENVPTATLVRRLESYGFAALYLNRKGYEDRAEKILAELTGLGYDRRLQGAGGQQVVVLLHPVASPTLPLGSALTFGNGWNPRTEAGVRWANGDAAMSYFNPHSAPLRAELRLEMIGVSPRDVVVSHQGRPVATAALGTAPVEVVLPALSLEPGVNVFKIESSAPAQRVGSGRNRLRSLGLKSSSIKPIGEEAAAVERGLPDKNRR
jgi:phosphoglycerol transferase